MSHPYHHALSSVKKWAEKLKTIKLSTTIRSSEEKR